MGSVRILPISHPFPSSLPQPTAKSSSGNLSSLSLRAPPSPRAAENDDSAPAGTDQEQQPPFDAASIDDPFDSRLAQVRLKYRSGTGKKADQRRQRKSKPGSSGAGGKPGSLMLPPIPLREPKAAGGRVKVEVGFTSYSERLNGAAAGLGLAALFLVELGSGKGLLSFHTPAVLFLQLYTVASLGAVFVKWEKERISVWPDKAPARPSSAAPATGE